MTFDTAATRSSRSARDRSGDKAMSIAEHKLVTLVWNSGVSRWTWPSINRRCQNARTFASWGEPKLRAVGPPPWRLRALPRPRTLDRRRRPVRHPGRRGCDGRARTGARNPLEATGDVCVVLAQIRNPRVDCLELRPRQGGAKLVDAKVEQRDRVLASNGAKVSQMALVAAFERPRQKHRTLVEVRIVRNEKATLAGVDGLVRLCAEAARRCVGTYKPTVVARPSAGPRPRRRSGPRDAQRLRRVGAGAPPKPRMWTARIAWVASVAPALLGPQYRHADPRRPPPIEDAVLRGSPHSPSPEDQMPEGRPLRQWQLEGHQGDGDRSSPRR